MSHLRLSKSRNPDGTNRFSRPRESPRRRLILLFPAWLIVWLLASPSAAADQGVCDRTPQVRDKLVEAAGVASCEDVTPEHLAAVTLLDLSESGIGTLQAHDFRDLVRLQRLRLYGNSLSTLPPSLFHGLSRLERLALNSNQLRELPPGLFRGLGSLQRLWLYRNQLGTLPDGIFSGLAELDYLSLAENSLTDLPAGLFTGLSKLESLSLLRNSLSSLPDGVFGDLSSLIGLWLQENSLTTLHEDVFRGSIGLQTLKLDHNLLTALPEEIFHGLGSLRSLSLDHNLLGTLGGRSFLGLNLLQRLTLDSNSLRELPEDAFDGLSSLFELQLRQNRLRTLPVGIFKDLRLLNILTLDENSLRELPEGVFDGLSRLVQLPLQGNDLRTLPEGIFSGLSGLKRLTLNRNSLRELPAEVFHPLWRLRDLALEDNHLAALPEGVFDQNLAILGAVQDSPGLRLDAALKAEPAFALPAGTAAPGASATATVSLDRPLPVAVRLPYAVGGTASSADYADLSPAPEEGLLIPAGETRRQISLTILAGADKLGKTLVLTLGGLSEIGLRRSDGTGPDAPFLLAETLLSLFPEGATHTLTISNPDPGSTTGGICDRTLQVRDKLLEATGVTACSQVSPGQLSAVTLLDLRRTRIHDLQTQDFNGLSSLNDLRLGENRLTTLPEGIFTGLSSLERLEMPGNTLSSLREGVFGELSSLTWLDLGSNALTALPEGIFSGLANLETLWLNGNSLTELPDAVFQELSRLVDLNLGFNSLTALPEGVFDGLNALQVLKLHENSLMELPGGLFLELSEPEEFIPIGGPSRAARLESLWLQGNRLSALPQDAFLGLGNLRVLLLNRNSLMALPEGVFGELSHLEALFLSDNSIASLPEGIFQGLSRLEQLELDRNRLTLLPEAVFSGLIHLEWLDLSANSLSALPPEIFQGLRQLEELRLDGNRLAALPPGLLDDTLSELGIGPENQGLHVDAYLKARLGFAPAAQTAAPGTKVTVPVTLHRALPVSLRVPYSVGGTASSTDYSNLSPAPEEGLLFPAGETRKEITLSLLEGADKLGKTLVLTLGELSEIDLLRAEGTGPKATFLKAEALLSLSPEGAAHTLTVANPDPGSTPGGICDRTPQVRDKLLEATGVTACGQVTPGQLAAVTLLDLRRTGIHDLQARDFNGLSSLTGLSLGENRLMTLPEGIFTGLSSLERLAMAGNALSSLPEGVFGELSRLTWLDLGSNALTALPEGIFSGLANLETLWMNGNSLTELPEAVFQDLSRLADLNLGFNSLIALPEGVFDGLSALQTLKLHENSFMELPGGLFLELSDPETLTPIDTRRQPAGLDELWLQGNHLRALPQDAFQGLGNLKVLLLDRNSLIVVPEGVFGELSHLQMLGLSENSIASLPEGIFQGLSSLERLQLDHNRLTGLPGTVFSGLSYLEQLDLSANSLAALPAEIFQGLSSLEELRLDGNPLAVLPPGLLDDTLTTLGIGPENQGLHVDATLKARLGFAPAAQTAAPGTKVTVPVTLHRALPVSLQVPYAVGGTATAADYADLSPAPEEGLLFPAGETRKEIALVLIESAGAGKTIVFTLGGLSEIGLLRSDGTGPEAPFLKAETLLSLSPEGATHTLTVSNPDPGSTPGGICDRTPQVRDKLLEAAGVTACGQVSPDQLAAVTLLDLRRTGIHDLQAQDFNGLSSLTGLSLSENRLTTVPEGIFTGLSSLERLEMAGNALTSLPEGVFAKLSRLTWLDLGSNALTALPEGIFSGLASLETLWMNGNSLTELPEAVFRGLSHLQVLLLSDNSIAALPPEIFQGLSSLEELRLDGNPLAVLPPGLLDDTLTTLGIGPENQGLHVDANLKARLGFAAAAQTAAPGTRVTATVTLHRTLPVALRVPYSVGGTASSDDYADLSPSPEEGLLFPAGETRKELSLSLLEDAGNADKTLVLALGQTSEISLFRSDGTGPEAPFLKAETLLSGSPDASTHTITLTGPADIGLNRSFVPVILSAAGMNGSFFTSEMTLTNRGPEAASLNYTYTAHLGSGSGTASDVVAAGRQKIVPDAIKYLRGLGLPIPASGKRIGTLAVEFAADSAVAVSVRTTTAVPLGRAGLAYPGVPDQGGFQDPVYLAGLRQTPRDRSNLALQNMGTAAEGPIRLRVTVSSGDAGDSNSIVFDGIRVEPGGFRQFDEVLGGLANGYVRVEKTAGAAPFYAYGVINDQVNSDGSFVLPVTAGSLAGTTGQTLPVIVERGTFTSELTVTNFSERAKAVSFAFVSEGVDTSDRTARFSMSLEAGEQRITPNLVNEMRRQGVSGIGSAGGLAGALFAWVEGGDMSGIVIGARTVSPALLAGGRYGVFYNAVPYGSAFSRVAWVEGLQQNRESRSNLALVNTGEADDSQSVFSIDIYDGDTGLPVRTITGITVPARGWRQINSILRDYAEGATQGYVRIRKISGNNPFLAYGVINDGPSPGERSGDGAYLAARE